MKLLVFPVIIFYRYFSDDLSEITICPMLKSVLIALATYEAFPGIGQLNVLAAIDFGKEPDLVNIVSWLCHA